MCLCIFYFCLPACLPLCSFLPIQVSIYVCVCVSLPFKSFSLFVHQSIPLSLSVCLLLYLQPTVHCLQYLSVCPRGVPLPVELMYIWWEGAAVLPLRRGEPGVCWGIMAAAWACCTPTDTITTLRFLFLTHSHIDSLSYYGASALTRLGFHSSLCVSLTRTCRSGVSDPQLERWTKLRQVDFLITQ